MLRCRSSAARSLRFASAPSRSSVAALVAGFLSCANLLACAAIARIDSTDPPTSSSDIASKPNRRKSDEPTTGALGGDEKANTDSNVEGIAVTPELDFGTVGCDEERSANLVISNTGDAPRPYVVVIPEGTPFETEAATKGTLEPNGSVVVPIVARPTVSGETKANIVVTSGASFATVPAGVIGAGATLEWMTAVAAIGDTPYNAEGVAKAKLRNSGTRTATIDGFEGVSGDFRASPTRITLAPNAEADVDLVLKKGTSATGQLTANIKPLAIGLCAPAPPVTVTGRRVNNKVTVSGADWGKKDCNSEPTDTRSVVVRNYSEREVRWTLVKAPSLFVLDGAATGIVPPATGNGASPGIANVAFRPPALGADPRPIEETITIAIESTSPPALPAPSGGDHSVTLRVDVRGAVLSISPTELTFVARKGGSAPYQPFKIKNTGNETAYLDWDFERTNGGPAWLGSPQRTSTAPGGTTSVSIGYQPSTEPPNTATLTPTRSSGAKICNPEALSVVNLIGAEP